MLIYYSCIIYLWLLICRNMEMCVLTLKIYVWDDVFRIISITIINFTDYQLLWRNRKNERKQELDNVFVSFNEGKNNCLIFFESYWWRYWTHYIGRSVVRFLQLRRQLIIIINLLCKQTLLTAVYEKSQIQRGWQRCDCSGFDYHRKNDCVIQVR